MVITIASGKGGTGKTTFAVNLAYVLAARGEQVRLLDCDVEEPNDHLFVKPRFTEEKQVMVLKPVWDADTCIACGKCSATCHYNAIALVKKRVLIFSELCHSCGACAFVCPRGALTETPTAIGRLQVSPEHRPFFFAHGLLNIGEALAPTVVSAVKSCICPEAVNLLDAAPGTACPVVKALAGADVAVLVTEPTPFGLHDLKLALAMSLEMGIPTGIVINRSDGKDAIIADYAAAIGVPVLGRIPFKRAYAETYSSGRILVESHPELTGYLLAIYEKIVALKGSTVPPVPHLEEFTLSAAAKSDLALGTATGFKEITVISGKGGTGKTTLVASLAHLATNTVLADNDVDAADLHLLLKPAVCEAHDFFGGTKATIDPAKCTACGKCAKACHFAAIREEGPANNKGRVTYRIDPLACEGCGLCPLVCPTGAIRQEKNRTGRWYVSATSRGPMVHARLGIAEENSGRLVAQVRSRAGQLADAWKQELILGDGPPGTGCPVIASVTGTDLVVIVTEPTVSGVHDMERVMQLAAHFRVPAVVVINKADLNLEQAQRIEEIAQAHHSRVIGRIPFDRVVNDALMAGKTVIEYGKGNAEEAIRGVWAQLQAALAAGLQEASPLKKR